jgi:hypothetical protein
VEGVADTDRHEPFADAVRWPVAARLRLSDRLARQLPGRLPGLLSRLAPRFLAEPAGSRLRRSVFNRAITIGWSAFDRRDWDYLEGIYDPGVVTRVAPDVWIDSPGRADGWEETRQLLADTLDGFDESDQRPVEIIDPGGPHMVALVEGRIAGSYSGLEVRRTLANVYEFSEAGLIIRQWSASDLAGAERFLNERLLKGARPG